MLEKGVSARSSFFGLSGARLRAFAAIPFFLFRVALASEKHLFAKPIKNQCKINGFGLSWSCSGCSRGHPWGPLGPPGGTQGSPKEALGGSIYVMNGLWGASGANLGPRGPDDNPWGSMFAPFWAPFGVRVDVSFCCEFIFSRFECSRFAFSRLRDKN